MIKHYTRLMIPLLEVHSKVLTISIGCISPGNAGWGQNFGIATNMKGAMICICGADTSIVIEDNNDVSKHEIIKQ